MQTDHGYHGAPMLGGAAAQSIMYSSGSNPIELTGDVDLEYLKQQVRESSTAIFTLPNILLTALTPHTQWMRCSHD